MIVNARTKPTSVGDGILDTKYFKCHMAFATHLSIAFPGLPRYAPPPSTARKGVADPRTFRKLKIRGPSPGTTGSAQPRPRAS